MLESKKIKKELFILQEGDDVYMSCSVTANPPISHIVWTHNVSEIRGNKNVVFSFFRRCLHKCSLFNKFKTILIFLWKSLRPSEILL